MSGSGPAIDQESRQKAVLLALRQARARVEALEQAASEPLAIIGAACRFPGDAGTPDAYWQLLRSGTDAISEVPADRWDISSHYDADPMAPGKMITRRGGFLSQVDQFDPQFFGISPREAVSMDPQQRLALEVSWEAIERAGLADGKLAGSRTGVFLGASTYDYSLLAASSPGAMHGTGLHRVTGCANNIIAGRVSYTLGLRGPSLVVDTACSSALVAVHLAGQSLRTGECDLALAGGVSLMLTPDLSIMFSKASMLSPDGRCKTFDAAADGFVRGEGCGIVVLRRLPDALSNGDPILAVVRGSAINSDGRSSGLTAPNGQAQQALIRSALASAHASPAEIGYVEAHGTGTALGDPIEVRALAAVLGHKRGADDPVVIGAVKTNIGHLEAAAGIAGLIKTVLVLQHEEIPPNLHLRNPNPHIPWGELPVTVPTRLMPWHTDGRPRLAGVSSFGFSGTNAHVILGEGPAAAVAEPAASRPVQLLCLSAKDGNALRELAGSYQRHLAAAPDTSLASIAHTAHTGRAHFSHRAALTARSAAEMRSKLDALAASAPGDGNPAGVRTQAAGNAVPAGGPPVAFLFSGQGTQYPGMGRQLYQTLPVFRAALRHCDELLRPHLGRSLLSVLYPEPGGTTPLDDTTYTQPALFALEYALAETWRAWGITPSAVMGHSVGEYAAACVAGVLSLEDAASIIARRARLMGDLPEGGAMAAVFAAEADVASAIANRRALAIAAVNGPASTVISGAAAEVEEVSAALRARGIRVERLTVSHAFHSPLLDPMLDAFEQSVAAMRFAEPRIDLVSNLTGERLPPGWTLDARYLRRHAREPVRFRDGIASLHELGYRLFVEVGPQPVLLAMGSRCLPAGAGVWLPSLRPNGNDWHSMLDSLGALYVHGVDADWENFDRDFARQRVVLPTYPFQRQRYWPAWHANGAGQRPHAQPSTASAQAAAGSSPQAAAASAGVQATPDWLYLTEWRTQAPAAGEAADLAGHWFILADSGGVGRELARVLAQHKATSDLIFAESWKQHRESLFANPPAYRGVVHLWGLDATPPAAETSVTSLRRDQELHCASVLAAVKSLAAARQPESARLWIVTRGAQPVTTAGGGVAVTQSPLWGLGKAIALEHPELWGGLIDLDPQAPASAAADDAMRLLEVIGTHAVTTVRRDGGPAAAANSGSPVCGDQAAWRGDTRYAPRLTRVASDPARPVPLRADASYMITGGLGGLGSVVAAWMARRGARHIALVGRSATPNATAVAALTATGAQVMTVQADVSQPGQLASALLRIAAAMPPLRGVVHAAGVLDDGLLADQDWSRFQRVAAPKVEGAWNLHQLTRTLSLDFFVLFSSTASLFGSPGQGSYAAANAFLDALAHHRRAQGLPALTINWGPWDLGMTASVSAASRRRWASMGLKTLTPDDGLQALACLLGGSHPQVAAVRADWARISETIAGEASRGLRALLAEETGPAASIAPPAPPRRLDQLLALAAEQRPDFLRACLRQQAGQILGMAPGDLPANGSFLELGMDSLMVMETARAIQRDFELTLYPRELYEHPTVDSLAVYLDGELAKAHVAQKPPREGMARRKRTAPARVPAHRAPRPPAARPVTVAHRPAGAIDQAAPPQTAPSPVFLLSAPRSGSTLLRVMLAGHPMLFCPPELHLLAFSSLARQRGELDRSYLHEGLQRALMELRGCDAPAAKALMDRWAADDLPIYEVYARLRQLAAPRLLVDKSPTYAASMDTLSRAEALFSDARYLCLVRHPYAVIESFARNRMHKLIGLGNEDPFGVAEQAWAQTNQNLLHFLRGVAPERQRTIRFEDLVRDPAQTAGGICDFLGIPADPAVLQPYEGQRMTDGVHGQSLSIGDPNFLSHDHIEADMADAWQRVTLPDPLRPATRHVAAALGYALPGAADAAPTEAAAAGDAVLGGPVNGHQRASLAITQPITSQHEYSVPVQGLRLCVCAWGPEDGPPIVCLHGILDQAMSWEDVARPLAARGYRFIAPDQRGHGCSAHAAAGGYHLMNYVADLDALLNGLACQIASRAEPAVLVGHSMGATVAATLASLRPGRVRALLLVEGLMPGQPSSDEFAHLFESHLDHLTSTPAHAVLPDAHCAAERLRKAMPSLSPEKAHRLARRITQPHGDGVRWRWDPALLTRADLSYDSLSITPDRYDALLSRITAPATLIYADAGNPHLARLRLALPEATTEVLPGGHNLHLDAPTALAEAIANAAVRAGVTPASQERE